jgi:nucleobase:cation symporter-1, NCS1 family
VAITERIERTIEKEAPAWGVRPTTPEVRRLQGLDFAVLWGDLALGLLVLVTGALLVPALGLPQALLAILLGSALGCIPLALVGRAGAREGVPGMVLLRSVLGTRGSYLPTVLNVLQLIGWTAFELWAMALVASTVTGTGEAGFYAWLGVATVVCLLLSLGGPVLVVRRWMERFGLWVLAAAAGWITYRAVTTFDVAELWSRPGTGGLPFGSAVDLVIAMPVSWIPLVADYNRFARSGVSSTAGTYLGYAAGNVWFYTLGALLVLGAGSVPSPAGIADGIATLAGGTLVLVVLLVGETDEAFADIYSAAVSAQNIIPRLGQRWAIVAVAAIGAWVAGWLYGLPDEGILTFEFFLLLIGSVFVPLFAVFLADRLTSGDPRRAVNVPAMVAWAMGFAAYHALTEVGPAGWVSAVESAADAIGLPHPLLGGAVPASVVSFAVAFVATLALRRLGRRS